MAIFLKGVGAEEVELVAVLHGEAVDDDVALRTLEALHGVDADLVDVLYAAPLSLPADHGNLVAVGHDDAHRALRVEALTIIIAYAREDLSHDARLGLVHLVGAILAAARRNEDHALAAEQSVEVVLGRDGIDGTGLLLMFQGHGLEMFAAVEGLRGELRHCRMHATLMVERAGEGGAALPAFPAQQPFEERLTAIQYTFFQQQGVADARGLRALLHHGGQLLVVADEDEAADVATTRTMAGEQTDEVGLQNLTGLIDDGEVEMLRAEQRDLLLHARGGAHDDTAGIDLLADSLEVAGAAQCLLHHVAAIRLGAEKLVAHAKVIDVVVGEHAADLVHGTVGVSHQENGGMRIV